MTKEVNQIVKRLENISSKLVKNKERNNENCNNSSNITTTKNNFKEQEKRLIFKLEVKWNTDQLSIIKSKLLLFTKQSTAANAFTTNESNNNDCDRFMKNTEPLLVGEEPSRIVTSLKQEPNTDSHPESRYFKNKLIVMEDVCAP